VDVIASSSNVTGSNVSTEFFSNIPTSRTTQGLHTVAPTVARSGLRDASKNKPVGKSSNGTGSGGGMGSGYGTGQGSGYGNEWSGKRSGYGGRRLAAASVTTL
jgi:hypothetical protein